MAVERLCPQCGKKHTVKRITKVYCSTLCRVNAANAKKRQLIRLEPHQQPIEEPTMKESQRQQDTAEHLRSYIAKHCHRMTPEQVADELQVPLFAVKMLWPNPSR